MVELINKIEIGLLPLNRIHFHTINMQIICNNGKVLIKSDQWGSPKLALAKSLYSAYQTANIILNEEIDSSDYKFSPD